MRIYLLGYMGCGKTTAGKQLAKKLGYDFVDMDDLLVKTEKRSINEIFATDGEDSFRKIEQRTMQATFKMDNVVIATGGGAPCFFDNIEQMNKHGITIYIQMTPKGLIERLKGAMNHRPILKDKTPEELYDFIAGAISNREPFYTKAKKIVDGVTLSADSLNDAIEAHKKVE